MKYIVILGDGMADLPVKELDNKTPLEVAKKENIDDLASKSVLGLVKTVPEDFPPGSDVANLSVMGYSPKEYYRGRSPLEAVSMGIELSEADISFRCNLVTLSDEISYKDKFMADYCSGEISSEEAKELIQALNQNLYQDFLKFFPGISYRHLLVWYGGPDDFNLTPPHDISGQKINNYLPKGNQSDILTELMEKSYEILSNHPVNKIRIKKGLNPANSIWLWGEGKKPFLNSFTQKYNKSGSVISAVDLVKGIGICADLKIVHVEGATGNIHTNFSGKAKAAVEELKNGQDFVYLHIEAPDECGHQNQIEGKVKSIEYIDSKVVKYVKDELDKLGEDYRIMILPDHPTPLSTNTHSSVPVPFLIYDSTDIKKNTIIKYNEYTAKESNVFIDEGHTLMDIFLQKK